jgi:hypothetical protein
VLAAVCAGCGRSSAPDATAPNAATATREATEATEVATTPLVFQPAPPEAPPPLWRVELRLTAAAYQQLEPTRGGMFFRGGGGQAAASPPHTAEARARGERPQPAVGFFNFGEDSGAGTFGFDFTTVKADVELGPAPADPQTLGAGRSGSLPSGPTLLRDVGVRYKGNGSFQTARATRKRSFKLEFDHFVPDQTFEGRTKLNVNCNALDATQLRDPLGYRLFAAAGLPAPQTRFAEVFLQIDGTPPELLGLYTLVEQVGRKFLREHLGSTSGLLLKPEGIKGIPWFGTEIYRYEQPYNAKWPGTDRQWERVIEFARVVNQADDREFEAAIDTLLDVDRFLRFLACQVLLGNLDSFLGSGHNYYLYLDDATNRFVFLPWDLDLAFGGFFLSGSVDELANLSLEHPHQGNNRLIDRLLQNPARRATYLAAVRDLVSRVFHPQGLGAVAAEWERFIAPCQDREAAARQDRGESADGMFGMWGQSALAPAQFIERRTESVLAQLAGTADGYVPRSAWGGGRGGGPGAGGPGGGQRWGRGRRGRVGE